MILVHTGYKEKLHDLEKLSGQASRLDPRLLTIFPQATEQERTRFKLLKDAYTAARYDKQYRITIEELQWLGERVRLLREMVVASCSQKMQDLSNPDA